MRTPVFAAIAVLATSLVTGAAAVDAPTLDARVATLEAQVEDLTVEINTAPSTAAAVTLAGCITSANQVAFRAVTINGVAMRIVVALPDWPAKPGAHWVALVQNRCLAKPAHRKSPQH